MQTPHKDIIKIESIGSTNDFARDLLNKDKRLQDFTTIWAQEQTKGRGQVGNVWESEKGKNITASIIVFPVFVAPEKQFYVSMAVSLAITKCLERFVEGVTIKWPNDIYVGNKKICGILIENTLSERAIESSIVGIGLNINQESFSDWIPNPTSLYLETGKVFEVSTILGKLVADIASCISMLSDGNMNDIASDYRSKIYQLGEARTYKDKNGVFEGRIVNVLDSGVLQVEHSHDKKTKNYLFKELEYIAG